MSVYSYFLPTFLQSVCLQYCESGITLTTPHDTASCKDESFYSSEPEYPSQKVMTSPPRTPTKTLNLSIYSKF